MRSPLKRKRYLVLALAGVLAAAAAVAVPAQDVSTKWFGPYQGVYYRLCRNTEGIDYYDCLQWRNANTVKVTVTWTWSIGDSRGTSAVDLEPSEDSPLSAISRDYRVLTVRVARK
jgi:hypothetical protein